MSVVFWFALGTLFIFYGVLLVSLLRILKALHKALLDSRGAVYVVGFTDSAQGRLAYKLWRHLSEQERQKIIPTEGVKDGTTVCLLPGMTLSRVDKPIEEVA